tara:strand:+ start:354 stop:566 length:213 start_codon:yes stop_codon:yes gene_type:complete
MAGALYAGLGLIAFLVIISMIWLTIVHMKVSKIGKDLKNVTKMVEFLDGENAVISAWALRTQEELHPGST